MLLILQLEQVRTAVQRDMGEQVASMGGSLGRRGGGCRPAERATQRWGIS